MTTYRTVFLTASLATLLALFAPAPGARADIFKWQYINPANPGLGKQPSTMLAPDGAGANAVPGANLSNRNLTMAYLVGADLGPYGDYYPSDLTGTNLSQADLTNAYLPLATVTNADFSQANLTNTNFRDATLAGVNLTGAEVRGASFSVDSYGTGIAPAQLYTTASYQNHDLTGISLEGNNLSGANLAGQSLANSSFYFAMLDNANFSQANLTKAFFFGATLTGANLNGADVRGAAFTKYGATSGITLAQLYLTASYQAHDLAGIALDG
jgi:uncharacterized protein YjbI with pentapeptide repeats